MLKYSTNLCQACLPKLLVLLFAFIFNASNFSLVRSQAKSAGDFQATTNTDVACLAEVVRALLSTDPCMGNGMAANGTNDQGRSAVAIELDPSAYMDQRQAQLQAAANQGLANCGNNIRLQVGSVLVCKTSAGHELDAWV